MNKIESFCLFFFFHELIVLLINATFYAMKTVKAICSKLTIERHHFETKLKIISKCNWMRQKKKSKVKNTRKTCIDTKNDDESANDATEWCAVSV